MATLRIYPGSEKMSADDAGYEALIRELFANKAIRQIDGRASTGEQFSLTRANGKIEEARWTDKPEHWVCEECGHSQAQRFTTCPGCGTQELIEKRSAGWQYRTYDEA